MQKARFIPAEYQLLFSNEDLNVQVWGLDLNNGQFIGKCYIGKQSKAAWFYKFPNRERLVKQFDDTVAGVAAREKMKAEAKAARKVLPQIALGDVFKCSWGYEQTNIDYYEITKIISPTLIEITPLAQNKIETQWLAGKCSPAPGSYTGEAMRKKVISYNGEPSIKIYDFASAYKMKPISNDNGQPVYETSYWSAYA